MEKCCGTHQLKFRSLGNKLHAGKIKKTKFIKCVFIYMCVWRIILYRENCVMNILDLKYGPVNS